jgi:hypothetical protein
MQLRKREIVAGQGDAHALLLVEMNSLAVLLMPVCT